MAKSIVMVLGVVFVIVGILGFFNNPVLGLFSVNALHNVVHLLSGVIGIAMARMGEASAKTFAKIFGVVYLLVAVIGFVSMDSLSFLANGSNDNWLHLLLALLLLYAGFSKGSTAPMPSGMGSGM